MTCRLIPILLLALAGCQQEMAHQPSYRPLQASSLFDDGLSARPLVSGTVHRDYRPATGLKSIEILGWDKVGAVVGTLPANPLAAASVAVDLSIYVDAFPMAITEKVLKRGENRFNIYCAVCHDRVGNGHGMIVQRGFTPPPNLHTDLSRGFQLRGIKVKLTEVRVGYIFEVVARGYGAMPDYASQIPSDDRWAIVAYVRALQLSQNASLDDVSDPAAKQRLILSREQKK
jgi:mono/diheme cytochrome c family protein